MAFGTGLWKEGRYGAVSLCYHDLPAGQLETVVAHHAAVGIRATLADEGAAVVMDLLTQRNWDLPARDAVDQRVTFPISAATYQLGINPGAMLPPPASLPAELPSLPVLADGNAMQALIESVVTQQQWVIVRMDGPALTALGLPAHQALMQWLGTHHARIWCAPIRDIGQFCRAATGA
ncbi:MAG: hypothetical protein WCJ97_03190 [Phycisphaerae bacterium]